MCSLNCYFTCTFKSFNHLSSSPPPRNLEMSRWGGGGERKTEECESLGFSFPVSLSLFLSLCHINIHTLSPWQSVLPNATLMFNTLHLHHWTPITLLLALPDSSLPSDLGTCLLLCVVPFLQIATVPTLALFSSCLLREFFLDLLVLFSSFYSFLPHTGFP